MNALKISAAVNTAIRIAMTSPAAARTLTAFSRFNRVQNGAVAP